MISEQRLCAGHRQYLYLSLAVMKVLMSSQYGVWSAGWCKARCAGSTFEVRGSRFEVRSSRQGIVETRSDASLCHGVA
jgi:hypothetical protein